MANLTMLHWEKTPSASYTYGSKIDYLQDGSVTFSNTLQAPGTPLHYWENLPAKADRKPHDQLPLLDRGQTYAYSLVAEVQPKNSVAVNISFMDEKDHIISQHYGQHLQGEFEMPLDAKTYRIELLNINNQVLHFFACYLAQADTLLPLMMQEPIVSRLLHVHNDAAAPGREMVVVRQRIPTEIFALSQAADQYFLRIPARLLNDHDAIRAQALEAYQKLHLPPDQRLHWRVPTEEVASAMLICQKVFQNEG